MPSIRLLLIDANPYFAQSIQAALNAEQAIDIVAYTAVAKNILALCAANTPNVMIIGQIDTDVLPTIRAVRTEYPTIRIIALASEIDTLHARQFLNAGVTGYLLKQDIFTGLSASIYTAHQGKSVISSAVTRALL
jgi:DNA-binding NarL/FixJ family response regulator